MSLGKMIARFEGQRRLAVRLNSVRDAVVELGVQDEITFHPVDIDESKLRGAFRLSRYRPRLYADPVHYADIMYAKSLDEDWRRLVCVKEMMHLFDADPHKAASCDDIDTLVRRMSRPPELRDIEVLDQEFNDRAAILPALAILFPRAARDALLDEYRCGNKKDHDLAAAAVIPQRYIEFLMSDTWARVYPALLTIS